MSVSVALDVPGVTLSGTFGLALDTRPTSRSVTVSATGVVLGIAGQTLTGSFSVQQNAVTKEITLLPNLTLNLGDGVETFISATITGPILVTPQGVALDVTASLRMGTALATRLAGKLSFGPTGAISVRVRVKHRQRARRPDQPGHQRPRRPYVEISTPAGTPVTLIVMGQRLSGEFRFSQATVGGAKVVRIALSNVSMFLGIPGTNPADPAASGGLGLVVKRRPGRLPADPGRPRRHLRGRRQPLRGPAGAARRRRLREGRHRGEHAAGRHDRARRHRHRHPCPAGPT